MKKLEEPYEPDQDIAASATSAQTAASMARVFILVGHALKRRRSCRSVKRRTKLRPRTLPRSRREGRGTRARTTGVRSWRRRSPRRSTLRHGQRIARISVVMKFVAEGLTRTHGSQNVATMRAARNGSPDVRGPIRARSAQVPAHRTPTQAHVSTATATVRVFHLLRASLSDPGEARFLGLLKSTR